MLTEIYIEALLADEELADQVWDAGEIDDCAAYFAWLLVSFGSSERSMEVRGQQSLRARDGLILRGRKAHFLCYRRYVT